jgi:hypothetical protein
MSGRAPREAAPTEPSRELSASREPAAREPASPEPFLRVRLGHGANCSSLGSVIDILFGTAAAGAAIFAAVVAALETEPVEVIGQDRAHAHDLGLGRRNRRAPEASSRASEPNPREPEP